MNEYLSWRRGTNRSYKRATDIGDHGPIEGKYTHSEAGVGAEECVDWNVLGSNPADPVEDAESGEKITG